MERQNIIALLMVAAVVGVGGVYQLYQEMVVAEGIISSVEISELRISPNGEEILEGYWLVSLVVDQRDEMMFTIRPEDATVELEADPDKDIPPGSEIQSRKGITVILRPLGDPYVHGPVHRSGIAYSDGGYPSTTRLWEYYSLADPSWTGVHVPYQVIVKDTDGNTLSDKSFLSGGTDWDTREKVLLAGGMELMNLGQIWSGLLLPSSDLAYIFNVDGTQQFVPETTLINYYLQNPPDIQEIEIKITDVEATDWDVDISDDGKRVTFSHHAFWPQDDAWGGLEPDETLFKIIGWDPIKKAVVAETAFRDELVYDQVFFTIELTVSSSAMGFNPEKIQITPDLRGRIFLEGEEDLSQSRVEVVDLYNNTFTIKLKCYSSGEGTVEFKPIGAADTWNEFAEQTRIWTLGSDRTAGTRIMTDPSQIPLYSTWASKATLWKGTPSLYTLEVPPTDYRAGTFPDVDTGEVVIWSLPGTSVRAFLQFKAPTSIYDSVIFKPPYGDPEIVEFNDITLAGGGEATLIATVRNGGYTEDTFIPSLDLPRGMTVTSYPGDKSVPVGQTEEFKWILAVGDVASDRDALIQLDVTAKNSLLKDSKTCTVHLRESPGPIIRTGDLTVFVLDAETDTPLAGAEVTCAGGKDITNTAGVAVINDIREGNQQLAVGELEGYGSHSETIYIREGSNAETVRLGVAPAAVAFPLWAVALIIIIVVAVVIILVVANKKGLLKRKGF